MKYIEYGTTPYFGRADYREVIFIKATHAPLSDDYCKKNNLCKFQTSPLGFTLQGTSELLFRLSTKLLSKKTENDLKIEKLIKLQKEILTKLQPAVIAIAAQEATNRILKKNGKSEQFLLTEKQIMDVGLYLSAVATADKGFDPTKIKTEDINENMFLGGIILPDIIKKFLGGK